MTRVLVVDDSTFIRTVVGDALEEAGYEVETAATGDEAVDLTASFDPDVITMDVEMPGMDGIEAVDRIMSTHPTAILMLSSHTADGASATIDALERGALEVVQKPDGSDGRNLAHLVDDVRETVAELASADVSTIALARTSAAASATNARPQTGDRSGRTTSPTDAERPDPVTVDDSAPLTDDPTIVLGASTGGPRIVERILERLPAELEAKGVIVQHMPAAFTRRFADRIDAVTEYDVREAEDGDRVAPGEFVVAPGDASLAITGNVGGKLRIRLRDDEPIDGVQPSIDVALESAADRVTDPLVAVVLSGMGDDGAAGIEAVAAAGGTTVAQDEASSPVWGMPKRAIDTGCVDHVYSADRIPQQLVETFEPDRRTDGDSPLAGPGGEQRG